MKTTLLLSALLFGSSLSFAQCGDPINIYTFSYNGSTYEVIREKKTWADAAACAVIRGGYLAEVENVAENTAIFTEVSNNAGIVNSNTVAPDGGGGAYVWLGGNDLATEGSWMWDGNNDGQFVQFWQGNASGSPVAGQYNNWGNEPDDFNGQDALGMSLNGWPLGVAGEWNDVDDQNLLYFVIEYDPNANMNELEQSLKIYPNPVDNVIHLESSTELSEIIVRTSVGQEVMRMTISNGKSAIVNVETLPCDVYFIELIGSNGTTCIQKFVK